ncbi:TetR family transcriptional regulator [Acidimicrobiaceae bacterium USS-CC1]|uniref:TetR family transcriptional regulator n=1 Tax=Acidiferrimicrobium australe TaxID=2664430 RepID=A0ABW9QWJ8_9ACTN|nr:TetR family transcriptional regulator [Acidiferrimicrobium australe]
MSAIAASTTDETDPRRLQILRAALDVIADRGYGDTRIADVAERVGVSPALVMYYFKSKDRLLAEAIRYAEDLWYAEGTRRIEKIPTAAGRLEELIRLTCLPQQDVGLSESWSLWIDLWAQSVRRPEVGTVRQEFDEHWRQTVRAVVEDGQRAGEFADLDAEEAAIALCALLDGLSIQIALRDPVVTEERAFANAMSFASAMLGFSWERPAAKRRRRRPAGR